MRDDDRAAMLQGADNEIRRVRRKVREDVQEIKSDRRERQDDIETGATKAEAAADRKKTREDNEEMRADRRALKHDWHDH